MSEGAIGQVNERIDSIYRSDSRRILATLIRLLGDFDLAEEALQETFAAAMAPWPEKGIPSNPVAWLISTGRFKVIDALRKRARFDSTLSVLAEQLDDSRDVPQDWEGESIEDDRLQLIFHLLTSGLAAWSPPGDDPT